MGETPIPSIPLHTAMMKTILLAIAIAVVAADMAVQDPDHILPESDFKEADTTLPETDEHQGKMAKTPAKQKAAETEAKKFYTGGGVTFNKKSEEEFKKDHADLMPVKPTGPPTPAPTCRYVNFDNGCQACWKGCPGGSWQTGQSGCSWFRCDKHCRKKVC